MEVISQINKCFIAGVKDNRLSSPPSNLSHHAEADQCSEKAASHFNSNLL